MAEYAVPDANPYLESFTAIENDDGTSRVTLGAFLMDLLGVPKHLGVRKFSLHFDMDDLVRVEIHDCIVKLDNELTRHALAKLKGYTSPQTPKKGKTNE